MKKNLILLLLGFNSFIYAQEFTDLKGDYFGQILPGDTPVVFAPGIISTTDRNEINITFSPDGNEVYFLRDGDIYTMQRIHNTWTEQVRAPFTGLNNPVFSVDGSKIYFTKWSNGNSVSDIWMAERTIGGWGEPQCLPAPINSSANDSVYTETADGVKYIGSNRSGSWGIWCISPSSGQAENLGPMVNSYPSTSPCVAPDGSYLIFNSQRPDRHGNSDLYVSFNKGNNEWTIPVNLERNGNRINLPNHSQIYPSLSPDGKYLFFNRHNYTGMMPDIYWVSTSVIDDIKKAVLPDPNGLIKNTSTGQRFSSIQCAVDYANPNEAIVIEPGIYEENINLSKDIILKSVDPNDPFYIGGTIIQGDIESSALILSSNSSACEIAGLTIRAGSVGVTGSASNAIIRNCRIMDNLTHGVELSNESNPHLKHCLITGNGETGINMTANPGRPPKSCKPIIENCIIVDNSQDGIVGGEPTIIDSLISN